MATGFRSRRRDRRNLVDVGVSDLLTNGVRMPYLWAMTTNRGRVRTHRQIVAQVAVEAVANCPDGYEADTRAAVLAEGEAQGVAALYLDMLR